ncbi:MAG: hypothetical protein ABI480_12385, partial [Chitinophagaceae bacterium]
DTEQEDNRNYKVSEETERERGTLFALAPALSYSAPHIGELSNQFKEELQVLYRLKPFLINKKKS